jgi:hypothetical protein
VQAKIPVDQDEAMAGELGGGSLGTRERHLARMGQLLHSVVFEQEQAAFMLGRYATHHTTVRRAFVHRRKAAPAAVAESCGVLMTGCRLRPGPESAGRDEEDGSFEMPRRRFLYGG